MERVSIRLKVKSALAAILCVLAVISSIAAVNASKEMQASYTELQATGFSDGEVLMSLASADETVNPLGR